MSLIVLPVIKTMKSQLKKKVLMLGLKMPRHSIAIPLMRVEFCLVLGVMALPMLFIQPKTSMSKTWIIFNPCNIKRIEGPLALV